MVYKQGNFKENKFLPIDSGVWCPDDRLQSHDANNLNPDISMRVLARSINNNIKVISSK